MPKIVLDQPGIRALVGQGKATGMTQHVRVHLHLDASQFTIPPQQNPDRSPVERPTALAQEKGVGARGHTFPLFQPDPDRPQFVRPERMGGGQPSFQPGNMQHPANQVNLVGPHAAGLGDSQPMPKHEQQKASIPGFIAGSFCCLDDPGHFRLSQVFSGV